MHSSYFLSNLRKNSIIVENKFSLADFQLAALIFN